MTSTIKKVSYSPTGRREDVSPELAAERAEAALRPIEGRWKLLILFHLFDKGVMRFSAIEKAIPGVTQKMLIQQLRALESDGIIERTIYPEVPPRVEYGLTAWGKSMCPALDALLEWGATKP